MSMLDQGELFPIPNPCRGICQVNNRGYCKGCLRSRQERFHWHEFTPFQQQLIINLCAKRRRKALQAKAMNAPLDADESPSQQQELFPNLTDDATPEPPAPGEQGQLF